MKKPITPLALPPEILARIAQIREKKAREAAGIATPPPPNPLPFSLPPQKLTSLSPVAPDNIVELENGQLIELNAEQLRAVDLALRKTSFCLTGAAGTGKTTTTKAMLSRLVATGNAGKLASATRFIGAGTTGIFFLAYTKAAVRNLRKSVPNLFKANCFTIHKFVEMAPEEETFTNDDGEESTRLVYKPRRNKVTPFPSGITTLVLDESSMIGEDHYQWLRDAIPYNFQVIFLGDINQLPTVANFSIFPQMLTKLPVVELRTIYRQAMESPIIPFAHKIKNGEPITNKEILAHPELYKSAELALFRYPKKINDPMLASHFAGKVLAQWYADGNYNPLTDIILTPWEKHFGWRDINAQVATFLDDEARAKGKPNDVYEVIANFDKAYYAVGDKVLYDKNPAVIKRIVRNALYMGNRFLPNSINLTRWGLTLGKPAEKTAEQAMQEAEEEFDALADLDALDSLTFDKDAVTRQASHIIDIVYEDGEEETLSKSGEINALSLGYATTVHKAQGSQWPRVIMAIHACHNVSLTRELLYTGVTRAEKQLRVLCELDTFERGVKRQSIKGDTVPEKIEWYRTKLAQRDAERAKKLEETGTEPSGFQKVIGATAGQIINARKAKENQP